MEAPRRSSRLNSLNVNKSLLPVISPIKSLSSIKSKKSKKSTKSTKSTKKTLKVKRFLNADIEAFFAQSESARRANFLNKVCSDAGSCITFGLETERIKKYFNNFNLFCPKKNCIVFNKIRRIGEESNNGFINEIPFQVGNYNALTVLKSSKAADSDNLYYEGLVGLYINKKNLFFPCFLETYGLYYYKKKGNKYPTYDKLRLNKPIAQVDMKYLDQISTFNYQTLFQNANVVKGCVDSNYMAILIQHIKNITSLFDYVENFKVDKNFCNVHLVNLLFQVYCPLAVLSNEYTHYDLHTGNVFVYEPSLDKTKHIKMIYYYPDGGETIEFNTFGVAKIIDYGRSFFHDTQENITVASFYDLVKRDCADPAPGYNTFSDDPTSYYWINSLARNKSHDLKLCFNVLRHNLANGIMLRTLQRLHYNMEYGTPEIEVNTDANKIQNVEDMHAALRDIIRQKNYKTQNDKLFENTVLMGTIHVWLDQSKPMEYISE